ncbi:cation diffusion facilitator family transporter [Limibaculum sp. M0105]|uniref:Cation diffusion facilitator family transporter n=1 Tax=Thermohalobaculum xanthum TaxID=2753746 RepID=A0A8J7M8V7_9RHOB|nr:cation diffusion facilitator family transporter [Thermohalobaculum xanthum]MBK0400360.1 cation diffusion facilitator family transporter [Thermohalobaculum xanthum]
MARVTDPAAAHRLNRIAGVAAIATAIVLICIKGWAWFATGSLSVAASVVDSALDLLTSAANLAAILYAARPPDAEHRFGHDAIEDVAALGQALIVAGSALAIGWNGAQRLIEPVPLAAEGAGIVVMLVSLALTAALVLFQRHVARRTGSRVVAADALHYLSDALPAGAAIAALGASAWFGVLWLDPVLSMLAAAVLLHGAWSIAAGAFAGLLDRELEPEQIDRIARIARETEGLQGFHDLKTRRSGSRVYIQIHVEIDGSRTLSEAHAVGATLRHHLLREFPRAEVIVHKDPV